MYDLSARTWPRPTSPKLCRCHRREPFDATSCLLSTTPSCMPTREQNSMRRIRGLVTSGQISSCPDCCYRWWYSDRASVQVKPPGISRRKSWRKWRKKLRRSHWDLPHHQTSWKCCIPSASGLWLSAREKYVVEKEFSGHRWMGSLWWEVRNWSSWFPLVAIVPWS